MGDSISVGGMLELKSDGSIHRMEFPESMFEQAYPNGKDGVASKDVTICQELGLWARIYIPTTLMNSANDNSMLVKVPVVVYFHGGGFCFFTPAYQDFDTLYKEITKKCGVMLISVNYRLSPEFRLPAAYEDAATALQWISTHTDQEEWLSRYGDLDRAFLMGDSAGGNIVSPMNSPTRGGRLKNNKICREEPSHLSVMAFGCSLGPMPTSHTDQEEWLGRYGDLDRVFLMGDSAGGNIVHHVIARAVDGAHTWQPMKIRGLILLQPFFGGEERTESERALGQKGAHLMELKTLDSMWSLSLPSGCNRDHPFSNIWINNDDVFVKKDFPKGLVMVGGEDMLKDGGLRYAEDMKRSRNVEVIVYEEEDHAFFCLKPGSSPNFPDLLARISQFVSPSVENPNDLHS